MITYFEEGNILSETCNGAESNDESDDESDDNSIMSPLISLEEMDALDYGEESDDEPMSMEMLEDIRDRSQSHPDVNRRDACYFFNVLYGKLMHTLEKWR